MKKIHITTLGCDKNLYLHLLVSGFHYYLAVQGHQSPLVCIFLKGAITTDGWTNVPVMGRHYDTFTQFQPPLHPHPERLDIPYLLQSPLSFFLRIPLLPPNDFLRAPSGFLLQPLHHRIKILRL